MPSTIPIFTRPRTFTRPVKFTRPRTFTRPVRFGQYIDPDVAAFNAFGVGLGEAALSQYILNGLTEFVTYLKQQGLWATFDVIYTIVGATAVWHSLNLKDPTTFRMSLFGTITHGSGGMNGNGINGYGNTGYDPGLQLAGGFYSVYCRTAVTDADMYDLGFDTSSVGIQADTDGADASGFYNGDGVPGTIINSKGMTTIGMESSGNNTYLFKNGVNIGADASNPFPGLLGDTVYFMAQNGLVPGATNFSTRQYSFMAIGNTMPLLPDNNDIILYTAVQNLQSALGRQV